MEAHEKIYKKLKKSGSKGWGGNSFDTRMQGWDRQLEKLFKIIELRGNRILELGSGAGDISLKLAQRGYDVTGIEISPTAVEWSKEKANQQKLKVRFVCNNVTENTFLKGEKFDLIIDGNCLHCLFDEDRDAFFYNLNRLIDIGGYVFISSAIIDNEGDITPKISSIDRCFVTKEAIVQELENRGFRLLKDWFSNGTHKHYYGLFKYISD